MGALRRAGFPGVLGLFLFLFLGGAAPAGDASAPFTVASYNLESYLAEPRGSRPAKSEAARAKVRESLLALRADVVALQEMGSTNALLELRDRLRAEGLDYPHWEHVSAWDTNISLAVLSRFPFTARRPHTNESFLLQGRRFRVARGFAEVEVRVGPAYRFTLINAHLKSRREVAEVSQEDLREQEALLLRRLIDQRLREDPALNLAVLGDFNDTPDTSPIRILLGRGRTALVDTRPAERNGDDAPPANPRFAPRNVAWTHYYGKADTYSRVDYLLLSPGLAREWSRDGSYVLALPNWGVASDHRPIVARFVASDR